MDLLSKLARVMWRPLVAMVAVLLVLAVSRRVSLKTLTRHSLAYNPTVEAPTTKPASIDIQIPSATLTASQSNEVVIPPVANVPRSISKVMVHIEGGPKDETVDASELMRGTALHFTPARTGHYNVSFHANGHQIASAPIVAVAPTTSHTQALQYQLIVDRENLKYAPGAGFVLPIMVQSSVRGADGALTPTPCTEQTLILVTDSTTTSPHQVILRVGAALSTSFDLPMSPAVTYHLSAHLSSVGSQPFDAIDVGWSRYGPTLQLQAIPATQTTYSTAQTPAHISVHYAYQGQQVDPPIPALIAVNPGSANVHLSPAGSVTINSANPSAALEASSGSGGETATISFTDPLFGTNATSSVVYRFPTESLFVAVVCGGVGVLVLLIFNKALSPPVQALLRVGAGMVGGLLAYIMMIIAWLPYPGGGNPVGLLPAILIGLLGGYGGQTVWEMGTALLRAVAPSKKP